MENLSFYLLSILLVKHYIADYFIQTKYQFSDKYIYGGPGGLQHAGIHGIGTMLCLLPFVNFTYAIGLGILDAVIHYHIDYCKSNCMQKIQPPLSPDKQLYWIVHGIDQMAHGLTYIFLVWLLI